MDWPRKRLLVIGIGIVAFLAVGVIVTLSYGVIPTTTKQVLIVVFVIGPLLLLAEPIFELVCGLVGMPVCFVLRRVPGIGRYFHPIDGDVVGIVGLITIVVIAAASGVFVWTHDGT